MEEVPSREEIITLLTEYCRATPTEEDERYIFEVDIRDGINLVLEKNALEEIERNLTAFGIHEETALFGENQYEIIVREESSIPVRRLRDDKIEVENEEAGLNYVLSAASDSYLVWLLNEMKRKLSPRDFRMGFFHGPRLDRALQEEGGLSPFDYIRLTTFRLMTLKIYSDKRTSPTQFSKLTHSFLFHVGYNLDVALVPQRLLEEIARRGRINRMRRSRTEELDPPRRSYTEDLVQHYLLAVSTDNPVIEYLSYYHVLEHFFESVFNDDLIESVRSSITDPGFSYKRKKDIGQLINSIKRALQIRSETITFSEVEALRLCIVKFVDLNELKQKLEAYDDTLIEFYRVNKVDFSAGVEVDFDSTDIEQVYKSLTKRIYSTRNALVHSKDGEKSKYTPFKDDRSLVKEVPLMRFISEMVILKESTVQ
ncbi:MAG: hypothetical protein H6695_08555 [Deferribacteres bacterium]|nr:hypothetical protein [Deferribacteres bacterium]